MDRLAVFSRVPTVPLRLVLYFMIVVAVCACSATYAVTYGAPVFPYDDAYISLHSADVLYHGADERFVGTPALAGATSPVRSEERRVGKECRSRWSPYH